MTTPVSFELAKLLEEKWFNEPCIQQYYYDGELLFCVDVHGRPMLKTNEESYSDSGGDCISAPCISAPTIAEVVMWLYEKHGIWIYPLPIDDDMKLWQARIIKGEPFSKLSNTLKIISHGEISYRGLHSPTEAYEAAIEYTLNNLL